jgi:arylsulfatase A-like enzyme
MWTLLSTASLLTGLYPSQHKVTRGHQRLESEHRTLAQMLAQAGYATATWTANPWINAEIGFHRGFERFHQVGRVFSTAAVQKRPYLDLANRAYMKAQNWVGDKGGWLLTQKATHFLARAAGGEQPFFLLLFYMETHLPYHGGSYARAFLPAEQDVGTARRVDPLPTNYYVGQHEMDETSMTALRGLYDAEIARTDARLGQLVGALKRHGLYENTLLVVTADHGDNFGEHGLMGHDHCLYDTLLHVPLVVSCPALLKGGTVIDAQVQLHDLYPTCLELAGVPLDRAPGVWPYSLLPDRIAENPRPWTFAERYYPPRERLERLANAHPGFDPTPFLLDQQAIRANGHKYIRSSDGSHELYDLVLDPDEIRNLADRKTDVAARYAALIDERLGDLETAAAAPTYEVEADASMLEQLRGLGYIE